MFGNLFEKLFMLNFFRAKSMNKYGLMNKDKINVKKDFLNQNFGDGKLEFVTFESQTKLGLERFFHGQAK